MTLVQAPGTLDDDLDDDAAVALVRAARPGVVLHRRPSRADERVLAGGGELFRLPLRPSAVARHTVLVRAMPKLVPLLPVAVAPPRWVGVLADGVTPFTAERRLPGVQSGAGPGGPPAAPLEGIALGQLAGVVEALRAVPVREAQQWGVPGASNGHVCRPDQGVGPRSDDGAVLLHGALGWSALLSDPRTGLLTGVVDWDLRLGAAGRDLGGALAAGLADLI